MNIHVLNIKKITNGFVAELCPPPSREPMRLGSVHEFNYDQFITVFAKDKAELLHAIEQHLDTHYPDNQQALPL